LKRYVATNTALWKKAVTELFQSGITCATTTLGQSRHSPSPHLGETPRNYRDGAHAHQHAVGL
jgi:hypothetical protein